MEIIVPRLHQLHWRSRLWVVRPGHPSHRELTLDGGCSDRFGSHTPRRKLVDLRTKLTSMNTSEQDDAFRTRGLLPKPDHFIRSISSDVEIRYMECSDGYSSTVH